LETLLDLPLGTAWIGFTASTGWDTENHDVLDWYLAGNLAPFTPRLTEPTRLPDGRFQMSIPTVVGANYQVQYSENLVNWFNAGPPLAGTGQPLVWIDAGPPLTPVSPQAAPHRFYKVTVVPVP
jgi:hypothetical protein